MMKVVCDDDACQMIYNDGKRASRDIWDDGLGGEDDRYKAAILTIKSK